MARQLLLIVCMALGASALRLKGRLSDIGTVDSSNCTWTEWSECKVESDSRCARERIFEPLSFENQSADITGKVPCFSQAGQVELETCQGGRCPVWSMGNWTDCSATCNTTMKPWEGFQRREVECVDASGILYRSDICANVYGVSSRPDQERACECSHKLQVYNPYATAYRSVDV